MKTWLYCATTASAYEHGEPVDFWVWSSYIEGPYNKQHLPPEKVLTYQEPKEDGEENDETIFEDAGESCSSSFATYNELIRHINRGIHKRTLQLYKLEDYALHSFIQSIEEIDRYRAIPVIVQQLEQAVNDKPEEIEEENKLQMGWANKEAQKRKLFSDDVIKFLDEKFDEGVTSGKKLDPKIVEKQMKSEKIGSKKRFSINDRLSARQIGGYFSRKAAKIRQSGTQQSEKTQESQFNEDEDLSLDYRYEPQFQDEFDNIMESVQSQDLFTD